ncbi:MAG TPA: hypothetical protein VMC09_13700 [Anaerolineales bacterium]|nr:hypothetical protein [Anaerolineales bacterium]
MHIIDSRWVDLAGGYQAVRSLQARLEAEFGRALQAGQHRKFRRQLTEWQKKRRILIALAIIAPLSIMTLCLTAYYFREVACVIVYWAVVVLAILAMLVVAGRNYIQEAVNRPEPHPAGSITVDLEKRWWASLASREPAGNKKDTSQDFMGLLRPHISGSYFLRRDLLAPDNRSLLVFGPSGLWLFVECGWSGSIARLGGSWTYTGKPTKEMFTAPDDQWLQYRQKITATLKSRLPQRAWTASLVQGGVVFSHPKARPDKARIQGNTAAYGPARAWAGRLQHALAVDGFTTDMQLEILDAFSAEWGIPTPPEDAVSARAEAERLYEAAVTELRQSVAILVK